MIKEIFSKNNFTGFGFHYWTQIIELGFIIHTTPENKINVLSAESFELLNQFELKEESYFNIVVIDDRIFLSIDNKVFLFDQKSFDLIKSFETKEQYSIPLNGNYFSARTYQRKPKVCRYEIWNHHNEKFYTSDKQDFLYHFSFPLAIFQERFSGTYYAYDLENDCIIWKETIDNGIGGKRFFYVIDDRIIHQQKIKINDLTFQHNVQSRDLKTGQIDWTIENCFSHYNYLFDSKEFIGYGGNRIHRFNLQGEIIQDYKFALKGSNNPHLCTVKKNHIIFAGHSENRKPIVGIVDFKKEVINDIFEIQITEEDGYRTGFERPFVKGNKLFLIDSEQRFRVLQMENCL